MQKYFMQSFSERFPLYENVDAARNYLLKRYALQKGMKTSEIDEEIKKRIINDPKFLEVKELTKNATGYTPMFTKFAFDQGADITQLRPILQNLEKYKQNLKTDLPMSLIDYENVQPDDEDRRPGWERLENDLSVIEGKRKLKKLYNEFTPKLKSLFSRISPEKMAELVEVSNQLERVKTKKELINPTTEQPEEVSAWKAFCWNIKKYEDTRTYPQYRDPEVAFGDLISDALDFIEGWEQEESGMINKLKELGPMVGLLYTKNGYIAMSARAPEAQRAVCSDTGWCIRTDSTFWSYGKGRVQINIINNNLPKTNPLSLVGLTVNTDGTIHDDADRPNNRLRDSQGNRFRTLESALKGLNYPQDLIDAVMKRFKTEADIKIAIERFYREQEGLTKRSIIESLLSMTRGFLAGSMSEDDWNRISGIVAKIIFEAKKMKASDFLDEFKKTGILSDAAWNVFKALIGDNYTEKDKQEIVKTTEKTLEQVEFLLSEPNPEEYLLPQDIPIVKKMFSEKDQILKRLETEL